MSIAEAPLTSSRPWIDAGDELRRLREGRGLSTRDVAERAGVSGSVITHWEQGRFRPKPQNLAKIAPVLGVPLEQLLLAYAFIEPGGQWARPPAPPPSADPLMRLTQALELGPWPQNVSAAFYALLAGYADNRRDYWERRFAEAMQAMLDDGSFLAVFDLPPGETTPNRDEQARTILGMLRARLFGNSPRPPPDASGNPIA